MKKFGVGVLQVGLTGVVTWFIFDRVGVDLARLGTLDSAEWRPRPALFLLSCMVLVVGYLWSASMWGRIVRDLGGPRLPVWTTVRVFMVANLGRYVPGKVWQIAGLAYLAKREGVHASVATGAAILGQGIALLGAVLVGMGVLVGANEFWGEIGRGDWSLVLEPLPRSSSWSSYQDFFATSWRSGSGSRAQILRVTAWEVETPVSAG